MEVKGQQGSKIVNYNATWLSITWSDQPLMQV